MSTLTSRERLRRCYFHQELDRPGLYTRTGFPHDDPSYDNLKALMNEQFDLKAGWSPSMTQPYPMEHLTEPYSAAFERIVTIVRTPKGELKSTYLNSLTRQPGMHETFLLKDRADAEKFLSLPLPAPTGPVDSFFEADRKIGERGIVEVGLGANPGGTVAELFGSENFALLSVTDRDLLHALCERRMQELLALTKYLLDRRMGPYFSMLGEEYIVPPLHGPKDFDDFNVRYDRPIIELIHGAGGRIHIHSHGSIGKVLASFIAMGTDVLHPFEGPPMGDLTAQEAKALARGRLTLEGNIQIAHMYEHSPDQIRAETAALIRDAFTDRAGLIVSPTASPYIRGAGERCLPQYQAMWETVREWRP